MANNFACERASERTNLLEHKCHRSNSRRVEMVHRLVEGAECKHIKGVFGPRKIPRQELVE